MITNARIMNNAVNADKIEDDAVQTIKLASGQKFQVRDQDNFILLEVINDTKETKVRGGVKKV